MIKLSNNVSPNNQDLMDETFQDPLCQIDAINEVLIHSPPEINQKVYAVAQANSQYRHQ